MKVRLMNEPNLDLCWWAIRTCYQSFDKSDCGKEIDIDLIKRVAIKKKHHSVLEHLVYTFYIEDISRALLQELARHRMASLSVKSTRYTLKELRDEASFLPANFERAKKYIVLTGNDIVDMASLEALERTRQLIACGTGQDFSKYSLPECYKTSLTYTINARSLKNMLELRASPSALWEFRKLSRMIYDNLPENHKFIFESEELKCLKV